jgi:segregation and condensation protein B
MRGEALRSVVESLLFVAEEPLTLQRLAEVIDGAARSDIKVTLEEIGADLESHGRGVRLVEVAGGYQLRTPKENADWVKKFLGGRPPRMGRATLETLAIIAYRQPVTKAEIEAIRGVDVDGVVNTLMERNLIRAIGRKDVPGRPFLFGTTAEFLQLFKLKDLSELPTLKELDQITLPDPAGEEPLAEGTEVEG